MTVLPSGYKQILTDKEMKKTGEPSPLFFFLSQFIGNEIIHFSILLECRNLRSFVVQ